MALAPTVQEKKAICKPKTCPTCGGVECFERPRYFCGQLLTDKDLDAAQRYVIEKNKLHNRYLVGTGVVCGLAVRCDPCDECAVTVEPGHAIDCCGNDIVLCEQAPFNVCEYIEKCLREKPVCEDKIPPRLRCDKVPKEYCLIVSYNEEPARPMTALIRDQGCSVTRCEPSRTKEIFRFDLVEKKDPPTPPPDVWTKIKECFPADNKRFDTLATESPFGPTSVANAGNLFFRMKKTILDLYAKGPDIRCTLVEEIDRIEKDFPAEAGTEAPATASDKALAAMQALMIQHIIDCFCDALLVPCAPCGEPEGVLLACLTVQDRKVVKICNLVRTQVITGPALRYWLGPLFTELHKWLEVGWGEFESRQRFGTREQIQSVFRSARAALTRGKAVFNMTGSIIRSRFKQFVNPDSTIGVDFHGLEVNDAVSRLREMNINVSVREQPVTTREEADKLTSLKFISSSVAPGSRVEIIKDLEGRVAAIRILKEGEQ